MANLRKEIKKLLAEIRRQGWRIEERKKGWMVYPPDPGKPAVMIHGTPSDQNAMKAARRLLRKSGFVE